MASLCFKRKEMQSSIAGTHTVQSSAIFPESQALSTMTNLTPISLLGLWLNADFLAYVEPLWKLEKAPFLDRYIPNQSTRLGRWTELTSAPPATLARPVRVIHTLNPPSPRFTRFKSLGRRHPLLPGALGTAFCPIDIPVTVVVLLSGLSL